MPPPTPSTTAPGLPELEREADALLAGVRAGDAEAQRRVEQVRGAAGRPLTRAGARSVVAREYGFPSWPKLAAHVAARGARPADRHHPLSADLAYYEDRAQGLLSVLETGQARALAIVRQRHPAWADADDAAIGRARLTTDDARLIFAREHGFESWEELAAHVRALKRRTAIEPFLVAFEAIKADDLATFRRVLALEPALANAQGTNGNSLLNLAVSTRKVEAARLLLEAGADPDLANNKGWTPLHAAAYGAPEDAQGASVTLLRMLLDAGARTDLSAHGDGGTPLVQALFWGHRPQAEMLAERGVTPLNLRVAAGLGRLDLLRGLFNDDGDLKPEAGAHREFHRPHSGFPPWRPADEPRQILDEALVYAAKSGRTEVLGFLVERGANVNGEPYNGTALHWAVARDWAETAAWLLDHGAALDGRANFGGVTGITPLHCAAWGGRLGCVKLLVARGADLEARDPTYNGRPLGWAEHNGRTEVAEYLRGVNG